MLHAILIGIATAGLAASSAAQDAPQAEPAGLALILHFQDGQLLFGDVAEHTPEHLVFERLDNGGRVRIPWSLLDPRQSEELRERFGYVDHSGEELFVEADRLFVGGDEVVGKIVNRTENDLVLKTSTRLIYVPKLRIQGAPTVVQVPALDIYTKDELYNQAALAADLQSAAGQVELARFCERILSFERAVLHYERAAALGAEDLELDVSAALALAKTKAGAQAELDQLAEIDALRARGRFDEASALADAFETRYEQSALLSELAKKRKQIEKSRLAALAEEVARSWHRWAAKLAAQAARKASFEEALAYVEGPMKDEIRERVLADAQRSIGPSVEADEILTAWVERTPGRWHKASYGLGTWLLGESQALAGLVEEQPADDAGQTARTEEEKQFAERVKRYLENQKASRAAKAAAGSEEDRSAFWQTFSLGARELWLLAYYAEHSGDMLLRPPTGEACSECGGQGVREIMHAGAKASGSSERGDSSRGARSTKIECPTCHHIGIVRRVSFR